MSNTLDNQCFFYFTNDYLNKYIPSSSPKYDKTQESYRNALTIFLRYVSDDLNIKPWELKFTDLTYDFVLDYRDALAKKFAPSTANHRLTVLKAYMKYVSCRLIDVEPVYITIMKVPQLKVPVEILPTIDNEDSLAALLDSPSQSDRGIRDRVILSLLYDTAVRVDELDTLDFNDVCIHYQSPYIFVHGKGSVERRVTLHKNTIALITQYIGIYHSTGQNKPFFYTIIKGVEGRMSIRNIQRIVQKYGKIVKKRGYEIPDSVSPHMLRRTRATNWGEDGVPAETIATLLGHTQTETARKHYTKPSIDVLRKESEKGSDIIPEQHKETPNWLEDEEFLKLTGLK